MMEQGQDRVSEYDVFTVAGRGRKRSIENLSRDQFDGIKEMAPGRFVDIISAKFSDSLVSEVKARSY